MLMIEKTCKDAAFQHHWLSTIDEAYRPAHLELVNPTTYRYELVSGVHPSSWIAVHQTAKVILWNSEGAPLKWDCDKYLSYVIKRSSVLKPAERKRFVSFVKDYFDESELTPVVRCHGDLTLSNVMLSNGRVIFMDPGHHRGLPCRELDESKLLQSMLGWDVVRHTRDVPQTYPLLPTKLTHWVLLSTHLVRLLNHDHPKPALKWAHSTLVRMLEYL